MMQIYVTELTAASAKLVNYAEKYNEVPGVPPGTLSKLLAFYVEADITRWCLQFATVLH